MTEEFLRLFNEAKKVLNPRSISKFVDAATVSAAIETEDGNIYVGVCVDTSCSLGVCAERNAIFNMITNGESRIKRIIAIKNDVAIPPCGACREFIIQIMPNDYKNIEIMIGNEVLKFEKLINKWWI